VNLERSELSIMIPRSDLYWSQLSEARISGMNAVGFICRRAPSMEPCARQFPVNLRSVCRFEPQASRIALINLPPHPVYGSSSGATTPRPQPIGDNSSRTGAPGCDVESAGGVLRRNRATA